MLTLAHPTKMWANAKNHQPQNQPTVFVATKKIQQDKNQIEIYEKLE
jgi:hypothetical protein